MIVWQGLPQVTGSYVLFINIVHKPVNHLICFIFLLFVIHRIIVVQELNLLEWASDIFKHVIFVILFLIKGLKVFPVLGMIVLDARCENNVHLLLRGTIRVLAFLDFVDVTVLGLTCVRVWTWPYQLTIWAASNITKWSVSHKINFCKLLKDVDTATTVLDHLALVAVEYLWTVWLEDWLLLGTFIIWGRLSNHCLYSWRASVLLSRVWMVLARGAVVLVKQ